MARFPFVCMALCSCNCLAQGQPVSSHSVIRVPCDGKGIPLRLSLLSSHDPDLLVRDDTRVEKESLQFCVVLVLCLLYPVTYGLHRKNIFTTTNWQRSLWFYYCKEVDLVVNKIPREWVLLEIFNNVNVERL